MDENQSCRWVKKGDALEIKVLVGPNGVKVSPPPGVSSFRDFFQKKLFEHREKSGFGVPMLAVLGRTFYHCLLVEAHNCCVDVRSTDYNRMSPDWVVQLTRHKNFEESFMFRGILVVLTYSSEDSICFI